MDLYSLNKIQGKKWFVFYSIFCINLVIQVLCILTFQPYWSVINYTVYSWINVYIDIIFIFLVFPLLALILGVSLLVLSYHQLTKNGQFKPKKAFIYIPLALLIGLDLLIAIFFSQLGDLIFLLPRTIEFFSFYLYFVTLFCLIFLLFPLMKSVYIYITMNIDDKLLNRRNLKTVIIGSIVIYSFLFATPFLFVPSNALFYPLPEKPALIAHRGVSSLAPENTLKAGELALEFEDVIGWEIDIQISYDGIPFLMHDDTLERTTNVEELFPTKISQRSSDFNISELMQLDAGSWYLEQDPFGMIRTGTINSTITETFKGIAIPTLEEALNFSRDNNLYIDFDIKTPQQTHPFYKNTIVIILDTVIHSNIAQDKILFPTLNTNWIELIKSRAPNILIGWQGTPNYNEYKESSYEFDYINSDDVYSNQAYIELYNNDVRTLIYTVESPIRYYQLWYLGVTWVKTNSPQNFEHIEEPIAVMDFSVYLTFWIVIYLIAVGTLCILVYKSRITLNKTISTQNRRDKKQSPLS